MTLSQGDQIGQYKIENQIGSGGMATVYRAYHERLDRYVAIKIMHQTFMQEPDFHARFEREARIVANLDHPNIVSVYDYDEHDQQPYLIMKFIEGDTLKSKLKDGPLTLEHILEILPKIADALTFAHGLGVLHRDIKPSNIMIDTRGEPYLTDFGLARIAQMGESTMSADMMLGTPQYISPEQAQGLPDLTPATDVYSLGIILYELVTGQVPFYGDNTYAIVHKQIYAAPPNPSELNPEIPSAIEAILLRALNKDPKERYDTPNAMIDAFEKAVTSSGLTELDEERISEARSRVQNIAQHTPGGGDYVAIPSPVDTGGTPVVQIQNTGFQAIMDEVIIRFKEAFWDIRNELSNNDFIQDLNQQLEDSGVSISRRGITRHTPTTSDSRSSSPQGSTPRVRITTAIDQDWDNSEASIRRRVNRRIRDRQGFVFHLLMYILGVGIVSGITSDIQRAIVEELSKPETIESLGGTFLMPLSTLHFGAILGLWWGSGIINHGVSVFARSGKRLEQRRDALDEKLTARYGTDWRDTISNREYRRVRRKVNKRYKKRLGLLTHIIGAIFFFVSVGIIWPVLSEVFLGAAAVNPNFPQDLHQFPVLPIVFILSLLSIGIHALTLMLGSVAGEDARERAIDREMNRERERTLAQQKLDFDKLKNEASTHTDKLKRDDTPELRLNDEGELTDSFAQEWQQGDGNST